MPNGINTKISFKLKYLINENVINKQKKKKKIFTMIDKTKRFNASFLSLGKTIANSYLPDEIVQNIPTKLRYNAKLPKLSGSYILVSMGVPTKIIDCEINVPDDKVKTFLKN